MKKLLALSLILSFCFPVFSETVTNNLDVQGGFIYNHGIINPGDYGMSFTNEGIRDVTVSAGQLSGVNPETGESITNSANLLPLKVQSLDVTGETHFSTDVIITGGLEISGTISSGSFSGDGSLLTNLNAVVVEMDPVWGSEKSKYLTVSNAQQTYLSKTGEFLNVSSLLVRSNLVVGTSTANVLYAVAEGQEVCASGARSHAEGYRTTASGNASHAEGYGTISSAEKSHAEGLYTEAAGVGSHAEGVGDSNFYLRASGIASHAEGICTRASGYCSHAEGRLTQAGGAYSHAAGIYAFATNDYSYVWSSSDSIGRGFGSTASRQFSVYADNGIHLMTGSNGVIQLGGRLIGNGSGLTNLNISESESDPVWSSEKSNYLTGTAADERYTPKSANLPINSSGYIERLMVGNGYVSYGSFAQGSGVSASGFYSHASGDNTTASGDASHAEGGGTVASGDASSAAGNSTTASGSASHAEGEYTIASGHCSHAEGSFTVAEGFASHAEGLEAVASGVFSHAEGMSTVAAGLVSHAAGDNAQAVHDKTYVWSDGEIVSSTTNQQYTVYAENGIRLLGGRITGDGSGLTNLNASSFNGLISASSLPTSGVWNASGVVISNLVASSVAGNLAVMTNLTFGSNTVAAVLSDLQQKVDAVGGATRYSVTAQVTDNETTNGLNLIAAYAQAKTMNPSVSNRVAVIVPPGRYDLGTNGLTMDTEYIDLIGLTSDRAAQCLYGAPGENNGVIKQTVDHVNIENLTFLNQEDLYYDRAAYFPTVPGINTIVRNCEFNGSGFGMQTGVEYAGYYEDCVAGHFAFGEGDGGIASGTFVDCQAGFESFGGYGYASGTFIRCRGGEYSFGACGVASGTFQDCVGDDYTFGAFAEASGTFIGCQAGSESFGGHEENYNGLMSNAVLVSCTAGAGSFGQFSTAAINFNYNTSGYMLTGGPIAGNGSGLTQLRATNLVGTISISNLPPEALRSGVTNVEWGSITGALSAQTDLWNTITSKVDRTELASVATTGDYGSLSNAPAFAPIATNASYANLIVDDGDIDPAKVNGLTNALANKVDSGALAPVAISGDYAQLTNTPVLAAIATDAAFFNLTVGVGEIDQSLVNGLTNSLADKLTTSWTTNLGTMAYVGTNDFVSAEQASNWVDKAAATNVLTGELIVQTNLTVEGTATFSGAVYIPQQGDLSMGVYTNRP